jgi:hypothetical protein
MFRVLLRSISVTLVLVAIFAGSAFAGMVSFPELSDLVPGETDITYADLVGLVVPSAVGAAAPIDDEAPPQVRHIEDGLDITLGSKDFRGFSAVSVRSGGLDRIALLLDLGEPEYAIGSAILALFDVSGAPALLDAVDVAFDRHTSFADPARISAGVADDLLVVLSAHHNTGQSYAIATPILVLDDRFELVDTIFMLGERNCAYERTQSFSVRQGPGEPFADIIATVADEVEEASYFECGETTSPVPQSRMITVTYRWDGAARKYLPDSDAFERLASENEERL